MPFDDDSDVSSSSSDYFESPSKARRDALLRRMKKEGTPLDPTKPGAQDLQGLKRSVLRAQIQKDDEGKKQAEDEGHKQPLAAGTKTREEDIAMQKGTSSLHVSADQLIKNTTLDTAAKQELRDEEVNSEGGA